MTASIRGGIFTMAMLLKGAEVAKALTEELHAKTEELKKNGVEPCLAILRVGAREDDLAYERGALKRCEKVGVAVRQVVLPEDVTQEVLMENIHALGADEKVHGVLMFRPLPGHLDDEAARAALDPKKDMDGITDGSMTAVYAGTKGGYPPAPPRPAWRCSSTTISPSKASASSSSAAALSSASRSLCCCSPSMRP